MDAVEPDPAAAATGPDPTIPAVERDLPDPVETDLTIPAVEPDLPGASGADNTTPAVEPGPPADAGTVDLVELALASVELSPEGGLPAIGTVSLVDLAGGGRLDIVMARADALLVQEAIAGNAAPRPRTHDLLLAAVGALGGAVDGVTLVERRVGGVYVANLRVRRPDGSTTELDARPSDALNVALRSTGAVLRAARALVDVPAS